VPIQCPLAALRICGCGKWDLNANAAHEGPESSGWHRRATHLPNEEFLGDDSLRIVSFWRVCKAHNEWFASKVCAPMQGFNSSLRASPLGKRCHRKPTRLWCIAAPRNRHRHRLSRLCAILLHCTYQHCFGAVHRDLPYEELGLGSNSRLFLNRSVVHHFATSRRMSVMHKLR
jgi:hypothetical protein